MALNKTVFVAAMIAFCVGFAGIAAAKEPAPAPAAPSPLAAKLTHAVDSLTAALHSPDTRQGAEEALGAILSSYYQPLMAAAGDPEAEVRLRAYEVLDACVTQAQAKRALASLSPQLRAKLLEFYKADHRVLESILSPGNSGVGTLQAVFSQQQVPDAGEALLIVCLRHGSDAVANIAASIAAGGTYKSPELVDALIDALAGFALSERNQSLQGYDPTGGGNGILNLLAALKNIGGTRSVPKLAAMMLAKRENSASASAIDLALADLIVALGDKSVLSPMMDRLLAAKATPPESLDMQMYKVTISRIDALLYCVAQLTGQPIRDYSLVRSYTPNGQVMALKDDSDRKDALDKIAEWWSNNRESLLAATKPALLPKLTAWPDASPRSVASAPAKQPAAAAVKSLCADISGKVKDLAGEFRSERISRRQSAEQGILEIHQAYIDTLMAGIDTAGDAQIEGMLAKAVSEAHFWQVLAGLPTETRETLALCREAYPDVVAQIFGIDRNLSILGIRRLANIDDPKCVLEPLLLYCLKQRTLPVLIAAAEAAAGGKYKSDETVDALLAILNDNSLGYYQWMWAIYPNIQYQSMPHPFALKALTAIKTPKALSALAAAITDVPNTDIYRTMAFTEALAKANDVRVVLLLMGELSKPIRFNSMLMPAGGKKITWTEKDEVLALLIRLTGQDIAAYKMSSAAANNWGKQLAYGFENEADRAAAVKQFQEWWEKNKDGAQFKNPLPPAIPKTPGG